MSARSIGWGLLLGGSVIAAGLGGYILAGHDQATVYEPAAQPLTTAVVLPGTVRTEYHGSGTLRIGQQLPAGVYQLGVESNGIGCTWQVLKALDGRPKSILRSGIVNRSTPDTVTLNPGDRYFDFGMTCILVRR